MAEPSVKVGQRVQTKDCVGTVAYVGTAQFAAGKWVGVVLDEPKGKNNGTVQGKTYFQCEDNHGVFVRQTQLTILDGGGSAPGSKSATPVPEKPKSRLPTPGSTGRLSGHASPREPTKISPKGRNMPTKKASSTLEISPKKERSATGSTQDLTANKRASFVETGFVESAAPVTPSPAAAAPAGPSAADQQREIDNLRDEVKDLNEKLETLKTKRAQDRDKLKELDKMRIQLEQLQEFKARMLEQQAQLQKELKKAKEERQEAIEERQRIQEETSDVQETLEMAALDKEMADEKAETLQLELDQANERIEELRLDLQILQEEVQQKGDSGEAAATSFQVKQLTQQNERLKETLIRMRDVAAHDKHELQRTQKEMETLKTSLTELGRERDKFRARSEEMEASIADLQEQVDAALGAEEMVEHLSQRNLAQEDKIQELQESVETLEALHDMNEEIAENFRETELELKQELDMQTGQMRQTERNLDAANEVIADHLATIGKFRELVQRLQDQNTELRDQLEKETNKPVGVPAEKIDFKKMFAETKAHAKAIEMDLRKIEVQQSNRHVELLAKFLPDSFLARGGDHDAVLVLLLVRRLTVKAEILLAQLRDRFPAPSTIDKTAVLKTHTVEQYCFGARLIHLLLALQTSLDQYRHALDTVDVETLLKVGTLYPEMAAQERGVDFYIELLRQDQLGENVGLENMERVLNYFTSLYPNHLASAGTDHYSHLLASAKTMSSACSSIEAEAQRLKVISQEGESHTLFGWLAATAEACGQLAKRVRRRLPQDGSAERISYPDQVGDSIGDVLRHLYRVGFVLRDVGRASTPLLAALTDVESGLPSSKCMEAVARSVDLVYGADDHGADSLRSSLTAVSEQLTRLADALEKGEYDFDGSVPEKPTPPVELRQRAVKAEMLEGSGMKARLKNREEEIKELKLALKMKAEELSEANVRREMAEKKLSGSAKDADLTIEKLQRKLDDANQLLRRKERESEETLNHLQTDLESLESERSELKEKLKLIKKKELLQGLTQSTLGSSPSSPGSGPASLPAPAVRDSPMLLQEIAALQQVVRRQRAEICSLASAETRRKLDAMLPLKVPRQPPTMAEEYKDLENRITKLKWDVMDHECHPVVPDLTRPSWKTEYAAARARSVARLQELNKAGRQLRDDVVRYVARHRAGGTASSDFGLFPSAPVAKTLSSGPSQLLGRVTLPGVSGPCVPLDVTPQDVEKIHHQLVSLIAV
ncbi:dynactin subunit 1-like isoform X2 [Amphibalanus amphitrite]|uniref:dynactin subunit 1-like isoform X2 n=1 Tax=Amphibalanus amphitrite TaxID=1232801 RepID=UPI001C923FC5|nr:dynactin subunit 1-like isoform X2 [Amphibalanus amphitrite]XP_043222014.1 dynactin subunit 1-like isoform X2 [Amphibalanus amphitrite]